MAGIFTKPPKEARLAGIDQERDDSESADSWERGGTG